MKKIVFLLLLGFTVSSTHAQHWYKGNLHTHSLWSDGDDYPEMIMDWYKANGYQFVGLSDHNIIQDVDKWVTVPHQPDRRRTFDRYLRTFGPDWVVYRKGPNDSLKVRLKKLEEYRSYFEDPGKFLIIKSEEVSTGYQGKPIHMNVTNVKNLIRPQPGNSVAEVMQNNIDLVVAQRRQTGQPMFPHINHPNFYYAVKAEDLMQLRHERFFEVFNGHHLVNNYGDSTHEGTESMWDKINLHFLQQGRPLMYGMGTDDSHNYYFFGPSFSNSGRSWVMVNAPELSPQALIEAMEAGRFYATSGVILKQLPQTGNTNTLTVRVKPEPEITYRIQFFGVRKGSQKGELLREIADTTATYTLTDDVLLARAKIISSKPKYNPFMPGDVETAWTQPISQSVVPKPLANVMPLPNAHAHNDYEQSRPLLDALDNGFTSVEADVHLIGDTLYVAHNRPTIRNSAATLENLYLRPLAERIRQHNGQVLAGYKGPFYLMIDAKTNADSTYQAIDKVLQRYRSILTTGTKNQAGPVTVVLSGNRPMQTVAKAKQRLLALDGRPSDLGKGYTSAVMPIISDSYQSQLSWRGQGDMPAEEFQKLRQLVDKTHGKGKKLRLWAIPEDPIVWAKLREAGVDFISTDQQELVRDFLLKAGSK